VIAGVISDGVIAPDYDPEALKILSAKKKGNYPVIKINPAYEADKMEYRDIFGITLAQLNNKIVLDKSIFTNIVTKNKDLSDTAVIDMIVTTIAVKYTQSNSVGYGLQGQVIGLGAGQQSRVDCVKLAGRKVDTWYLRQHPKVLELPFKDSVKRQERVNARVRYIESDMTEAERAAFNQNFISNPVSLSTDEKAQWLGGLKNVCLSSDAFFPFRDSIDQASNRGVKYLLQAGGSVREDEVISAADEYDMVMALSGIRLFHH
jgi:phosphoribosylaminoimidazolecarboxamide formyltransferase/IMP cyclohydrolase